MFERLIGFVLGNRLVVIALTLALVGAGINAWRELPIDAFPDVSSTQVKVILKSPGMTPEEVETRVVTPLEIEMLSIPNKRVVRSVSKYAIADITIDFVDGTDIYWARAQVTERLNAAFKDLPPGSTGGLAPITTPLGEVFMFTIESDSLDDTAKRTLLDWTLRPALRTLPGVADVNSLGGLVKAFEVVPDLAALHARGLTVAELRSALERNNRNDGAGRLVEGGESLLVRSQGAVQTIDDLSAIVVRARPGVVRVRDVAQVQVGSMTRYGAVSRSGRGEAVQGIVLGLRGVNARALVVSVQEKLRQLEPTLPGNARIKVFYNRGDLVDRAVGTVTRALAEAVILVVVMLVLFLGNLPAALVVAAAVPLSALGTFVAMRWAGMSANLMSLGGLAIAIGMLVDAAVVVVENVVARLAHGTHAGRLAQLHAAVVEVARPVLSGVLIIIIVFVPLLTLEGLEGKLFTPVAQTIVFALVASLLAAFTSIPVLASWLLRGGAHREPWLMRMLERGYRPLLARVLARPLVPLVLAGLSLVAAVLAWNNLGRSFMPTLDEGDVLLQLEKLPSISLDESVALDGRLQKEILANVPEVREIVARTGSDEIGLDPMGLNETDTFLVLAPREQWRSPSKEKISDALRELMAGFPGIAFSFTQPIEMRVSEMLTGVRGDLAIKIFGADLKELNRLSAQTVALVRGVKGAEDVLTVRNEGVEYYSIEIDRLRAGRLGLTVEDIQDTLRAAVEGVQVGQVIETGRRTAVLMRGDRELRASPELLSRLVLPLPDGASVPLQEVARLVRHGGPVKVDHENASRMVVVRANVRDRDLVSFVDEARAKVAAELKLAPGYRIEWGGQFENQQRAAKRLSLVVPIALAAVSLMLFLTLGTLRQVLLVLVNVPFAMIGGVLALWAVGEYLSVPASVGFIALLGIAVLNAVVMITHFNALAAAGRPLDELVVEGAVRRLRPVLMTATITALGLIPLVLATGPGSEIQRPLAIVVIGGLFSSTFLTLVLLPVLYRRFGQPANPVRGDAPHNS